MADSKYKIKKQLIVTIGREYGAGGRTSAKILAEELGIHYYDDEILKMASEESAISEELFRLADEKPGNNILRKITKSAMTEFKDFDTKNITSPDNLFKFQSTVIRNLAKEENFIILGRCANHVLEDQHKDKVLRIYLYADFDTRVKRIMDMERITIDEATFRIKKKDKKRGEYYKYFTGVDISNPLKYDILINTSTIGFNEIKDILISFMKARGFIE